MRPLFPALLLLLAGCASVPSAAPPPTIEDPRALVTGEAEDILRGLLEALAANLPAPRRVLVTVSGLGPGLYGITTLGDDGTARIGIAPGDLDVMLETIVHEWAHVRSLGFEEDGHGPRWGVEYAAAYREFLAWAGH